MNPQISAVELAKKLAESAPPRLLDVRELHEHEYAAIPNSTLIPLGQITRRANELAAWKDEEIVVYCHHGMRSQRAIAELRALGFQKLSNLSGGIDAWSAVVDPAVPRY